MSQGKPPAFKVSVASVLFDALRGIAAILVCLAHWCYLFFIDYQQVVAHRRLLYLPYLICSMGHQAVVIFFVMSGYLIGGHILRALKQGIWSWGSYLTQRLVRLWVVLLPALALGGILDVLALHFNLSPRLYHGTLTLSITYNVAEALTWKVLLGNIFFLQTIQTFVFGSNTPLWSLANEFWYYLMFPLGLLALRGRSYSTLSRVLMGLMTLTMLHFLTPGVVKSFPIWLMGAALAIIPVKATPAWCRWLAAGVYSLCLAAVAAGEIGPRFHPDYLLGLATAGLLWVLLGAREAAQAKWYVIPSRTAAAFSYTLYLVHVPLLAILTSLHQGEKRWQPDAAHSLLGLLLLLFVIGYAYVIASLTEFHTAEVRGWVERLIGGTRKVKAREGP